MPDLDQYQQQKEKILLTMKVRGPCLPVQIAKVLNVTPLFASAFLSELKAEDKIKISNMRVGGSPLYYLPGQEFSLENFVKYLNQREREAFQLLKENKILEDDRQTPVVRVALRAIKDFAFPLRIMYNGEPKVFWKHFSISDEEFERILFPPVVEQKKIDDIVEEKVPEVEKAVEENADKTKLEVQPSVKINSSGNFAEDLKNYLEAKSFEVMEVYVEKKKDFEARVRADGKFGKQEFYLHAKDKKNISEKDFENVWNKAHEKKLPAFILSSGELNKKGKEHLREWKNLIKWEKI